MGVLSRYTGFRSVWVGQLLSQFGNALFLIMGLWEIQLRSPFLLSIAGLVLILPASLAVVGGTLVDRSDPRTIMLWTDVLRGMAVALGLLALATYAESLMPGKVQVWNWQDKSADDISVSDLPLNETVLMSGCLVDTPMLEHWSTLLRVGCGCSCGWPSAGPTTST